jgi:pyruvate,water dikinase
LLAGGLVTDVGGILSHGAIVAREYGIPAVMSVSGATEQLVDGQIITVDGDKGAVIMIPPNGASLPANNKARILAQEIA